MRRRKEHSWRRVGRESTGRFTVYSTGHGTYDVYSTYTITYRQNVTGFTRREEERGPHLRTVLRELSLQDKDYALIAMLEGGFTALEKIFGQWEWKMRQEHEKEQKEEKKKKLARKRTKHVKDRRFGRVLEI